MRDMNNLKNAFGKADDGFENNVYRTLATLQKAEEKKTMKRISLRWAAAIAIACMMITTTALALSNTWGVLDFITGRSNIKVLPDAVEIIEKNVPQKGGQSERAAFMVREAVFDGQNIYIVVEIKPSRPEYLLLGTDANPSDPVENMGPLFSGNDGTIANYAHENNKVMIHTWAGIMGQNYSADFILEDDGTLVYMLNGRYEGDAKEMDMELSCGTATFVNLEGKDSIDVSNMQRTTLFVTLKSSDAKDTVTCTTPVIFSDCGVRVDKITLTGSAMAIYTEIGFTVIDEQKFAENDNGLWFEFLDENGERLPSGAATTGTITADDSGKHFVQTDSLQASEVLPSEIILRGYNCWEKNRYETHTFEMK